MHSSCTHRQIVHGQHQMALVLLPLCFLRQRVGYHLGVLPGGLRAVGRHMYMKGTTSFRYCATHTRLPLQSGSLGCLYHGASMRGGAVEGQVSYNTHLERGSGCELRGVASEHASSGSACVLRVRSRAEQRRSCCSSCGAHGYPHQAVSEASTSLKEALFNTQRVVAASAPSTI
jgi:hypothetical protein